MVLKLAIVLYAVAAAAAQVKPAEYKEKFHAEESRQLENYAQDALSGVYADCVAQVSFACLQRKVLNYVHRMSRMEQFDVLGQYVSVVKVRDQAESESEFQGRMDTAEKENTLDDLTDSTIDSFFNSHVIRVKLPNSMAVRQASGRSTEVIDLQFPYADEVEGRKKGGGGGGGKMGKKMMMMMMMGLKAKMMMMGPMMMGLAGLMAMKALIAAVVSLTISKIMIIKKLIKQKGSGGGGGHSHVSSGWDSGSSGGSSGGWSSGGGGGGGGGWDRRSQNDGWDASDLAYRAYSTVENLL